MKLKHKTVEEGRITLRAVLFGILFCILQTFVTCYLSNREGIYLPSTQMPVLPFLLLIVAALIVNPLLGLIRIVRRFTRTELMTVFLMLFVSAGIGIYGLAEQVVPLMNGLFNPAWNNEQSKWSLHVAPFMEDSFFVSETGVKKAAETHRNHYLNTAEIETIYLAAKSAADKGLEDAAHANAVVQWEQLRPTPSLSADDAVQKYEPKLRQAELALVEAKAELDALQAKAFEKVQLFRRGLPRDLRAIPGLFPGEHDTFETYTARAHRLMAGRRSLARLRAAREALPDAVSFSKDVSQAAEILGPLVRAEALKTQHAEMETRVTSVRTRQANINTKISELNAACRSAMGSDIRRLKRQITSAEKDAGKLEEEEEACRVNLEGISLELKTSALLTDVITQLKSIGKDAGLMPADTLDDQLGSVMAQYRLFDASLTRFLVGDIPWSHWMRPLLSWGGLIFLTYLVLMTFNVLIFRQWAYNEKLIYPLAELSEHLVGVYDKSDGAVPELFKSGLFWAGVGISASVVGWNLLAGSGAIPGLVAIDLKNVWTEFIEGTALEGLIPSARSEVFFTMIGLSFLIPRKISFSLWFFHVLFMLQLLILVWVGYGTNANSFPKDWVSALNFRTAEGGGALVIFSTIVLIKCRRYLLCCLSPACVANLESDERKELRISSALFLLGSVGIVLMLWLGMGANLGYTIFFLLIVLLITIGLVRSVAEGGILAFQAWAGPFHFISNIAGMTKSWTSSGLFAPLLVYYGVFFLDIKTFIAPAMANALKVRNDLRMGRARFHVAIGLAILLAVTTGILCEIIMGYSSGADSMNRWFHSQFPQTLYSRISSMMHSPPDASPEMMGWIAGGGIVMAALLFFRQFMFWVPHPIGLVMLVNPLMSAYWFSILLGWLAKSLVTKYGSKDTYAQTRAIFLGFIVGELLIVALSTCLSYFFDLEVTIDLNRNES